MCKRQKQLLGLIICFVLTDIFLGATQEKADALEKMSGAIILIGLTASMKSR